MKVKWQQVPPSFKITLFLMYQKWLVSYGDWSTVAFALTPPLQLFSFHRFRTNYGVNSILASQTSPIQVHDNTIGSGNNDNKQQFISEGEENGNFNNLPRLYVGGTPSCRDNPRSIILDQNKKLSLSDDQSHYLMKVMRFFSKKRKKKKKEEENKCGKDELITELAKFDASDCVRLFDGINGEWLCRIIDPMRDTINAAGSDRSEVGKKRKNNYRRKDNSLNLVAECIIQLRSQYPSSNFSTVMDAQGKQSQEINSAESAFQIEPDAPWLLFAPIKKQRAKFLIEKCTELGCGVFCPVITEHTDLTASSACMPNQSEYSQATSQYDFKASNISRKDAIKLPLVAQEAAEQCERLTVPAFVSTFDLFRGCEFEGQQQPLTVGDMLENWVKLQEGNGCGCNGRMLLICRERKNIKYQSGTLHVLDAFDRFGKANSIFTSMAFFIGPEGGWSKKEEEMFDQYCADYPESIVGVSLGKTVLRAETAGTMVIGTYNLWCSNSRS